MLDARRDDGHGAYESVPAREDASELSVTILEGSNPKRTVSVPANMTIRQFKQMAFPDHGGKNVRVIHCGKLLSNENLMLGDCGLDRSPFLHVSISSKVSTPAAEHRQPESETVDLEESMEESDRRLAILLSEREDTIIDIDGYETTGSLPVRDGDQQDFIWGIHYLRVLVIGCVS
jgi:hypothetical protein